MTTAGTGQARPAGGGQQVRPLPPPPPRVRHHAISSGAVCPIDIMLYFFHLPTDMLLWGRAET